MMKADVLNNFKEIEVCTGYKMAGEVIPDLTFEAMNCTVEPVYIKKEGWNRDLEEVAGFENLPLQLSAYISYIEKAVSLPVAILSLGPGREQTLLRN
jgi:adenylosuccinate synthase